ncbi:dephospho-CoA kinase [Amylibacter sp.]|nr:dephospho-CoA kinase [Amylibacter sp.]MDA9277784.1 dephospho-CoA kinase [Amylibacter sp.]MDA9369496.1 dephospho-CoA kinase [Amylibacter sp.]MDA9999605.1 dephospho-CoA kinase [Amylibacter sp.]MDB4016706.1 dephospho-CoA kinase [Amylibacter sp.]|tara:strand:- start:225 stop:824 length:600 start_codon:yes stop_codon:yes gene_type:complete
MTKTFILGLTGSIGMGKTTTAEMFRDLSIAVWDADAAVHELYTSDRSTIEKIYDIIPECVTSAGVDRNLLKNELLSNKALFTKIESIVHPAIKEHRLAFIEACNKSNQKLAIVDIPLLYETKADQWLDAVLVVSIDKETQRKRVMSRNDMNEKTFDLILSKQLPDKIKRDRADYVIETNSIVCVQERVEFLVKKILGNL